MELFHVLFGGSQESEKYMTTTTTTSPLSYFESRYSRPLQRLVESDEIGAILATEATKFLSSTLPFHKTDPLIYSGDNEVNVLWLIDDIFRMEAIFSRIGDDESEENYLSVEIRVLQRGEVIIDGSFGDAPESAKQIFFKFLKTAAPNSDSYRV